MTDQRLSLFFLAATIQCVFSAGSGSEIAGQLGLSSSTVLPFPSSTMAASDATAFIQDKWSLQDGISFGEKSLSFVNDPIGSSGSGSGSNNLSSQKREVQNTTDIPSDNTNTDGPNSPDSTVLAVTYEAGSYSHGTGGAQFYATFGGSAGFEAMLLSYDIAFDADYGWVKGGKLPGLRGGPVLNSCSGGREPTGSDCFSSRLMWRTDGAGEVYGYIPSQPALCNVDGVVCNSDYGFSFGRGKFKYTAGQWQNVAVYSKMNNPPSESNGVVSLYFNGEEVFTFSNIKFRTSTAVTAGGMYFSTFFGGSDQSWATPKTVHTYYRNFQMFGGAGDSTNSSSSSEFTSTLKTSRSDLSKTSSLRSSSTNSAADSESNQ